MESLSFSYNDKKVIADVSFTLAQGRHLSVIGESGCGKSTLLKLIYGLLDPDSGEILYNGNPILGPKFNLIPGAGFVKYLAQDFGLMPFITVSENVGKYLSNIYKDKKNQRISELLEMVGMSEFASVKPQHLSGGQQQRTALAMVLALEPKVLLLDEPFSQTDAFRTNELRRTLFNYCRQRDITCIVATHDATDVLSFADQVIVLKNGRVVTSGAPDQVYAKPKNKYVASMFGEVNEIRGNFVGTAQQSELIYPHQLVQCAVSPLKAHILKSYFEGGLYLIHAQYAEGTLFFESKFALPAGATIFLERKK